MKEILITKFTSRSILIILLISISFSISGQFKSKIRVVVDSAYYTGSKMVIKYNIGNAKPKDKIRVWIDVINQKNDTLKTRLWTGDVNKYLDGGGEKRAVWDILGDKYEILDSLQFRVSATVENRFHLDDPIILSTVYPGWGDYKIRRKKPYWIYGVVGWSCVGASVGTYISAKSNYNKYLDDRTIDGRNNYHNKAVTNKNLSYAFLGAAVVVWAIDYFGVIKRKRRIKRAWKKKPPIYETPEVPSFIIARAYSKKIFVNTRLTNIEVIANTIRYEDKDENELLDAFEKGYVVFDVVNKGPARAFNFYASLSTKNIDARVIFPDSIALGDIPVGTTKTVKVPIVAQKDIFTGNIYVDVNIRAKYNRPAKPFGLGIKTFAFKYKEQITKADLKSDVDRNIPIMPKSNKARFALVIGNEGYANENTKLSQSFNVPYARHDAIIFKEYLEKVVGLKSENIVLLLDANKQQMYEALINITDRTSKMPRSVKPEFILYYAGQGLSDTTTKAPYLLPVNVNSDSLSKAISMEEIYEIVSNGEADRNILLLDASFNNGGRRMGLRGPSVEKIINREELIYGFTLVFNAAQEKYSSNSYNEKNHGLFTYCLLEELKNSRGNMKYFDLYKKLKDIVPATATRINKEQKPSHAVSVSVERVWQRWEIRSR